MKTHPRPCGTVLVVEDSPECMKLACTLLRASGYKVNQANYPLQALFSIVRYPPDLILADLEMPVMGGIEFIRQVKGHAETRHIPIVVVTGDSAEETREAAFAAGCSGFITKPFEARSLASEVGKYF